MTADPDDLVFIAGCENAAEADLLKLTLTDQGIDVVIDGAELSTSLGYIGSAIGDVKVMVRQRDANRAVDVIRETRASYVSPLEEPWFCGKCFESVEGGFEICWSCGLFREDVEGSFPEVAESIESREWLASEAGIPDRETDNPYASPISMGRSVTEVLGDGSPNGVDSKILLALLCSVCTVFVPVIPAILMIYFLWAGARRQNPLSLISRILFWVAIAISGLTHASYAIFWLAYVR